MTIGYRLIGHGPIKVLAFHGWFGSAADWAGLETVLDPDLITIAALDQRGYGTSIDEPGPFSVEQVAIDGIDIADSLDWARFHVLGHSMGGKVAQRVLADQPGRVQSGIALTPVPASGVPFDEPTYRLFESAAGDDAVRLQIVTGSVSERCTEAWARRIVAHSRRHSREAAFGAYLHSWAREDFSSSVDGLPRPWLVLIGEHDPALGPPLMQQTFLKWFPVALLETISNCGHYPMWEAPVATGTRIQSYLRLHEGNAIT